MDHPERIVPPVEREDAELAVDSRTGRLRDRRGRDVVMRGVNTGGRSKWPPYVPFPVPESPSPAVVRERAEPYFERVFDWGLDTVRLPFSWEALEPDRGEYDGDYLQRYRAMVDAAWDLGLRVIVDFHQDVFAAPFCGDGFPRWAVPEDHRGPARRDHVGWFFKYAFDPGVRRAFERFWRNDDGLRDAFHAMWATVSDAFGDHPAVVGFEPMNEPGWGETDDVEAWKHEVLEPFYEEIVETIREHAPEKLVFYDAPGVDALYPRSASHIRPDGDGFVFAPHYYDDGLIRGGGWSGSQPREVVRTFANVRDDSGIPALIGEFGVGKGGHRGDVWLRRLVDALDRYRISATMWEYSETSEVWNGERLSLVDTEGRERQLLDVYARPWLRAVAGTKADFEWHPERRRGRAEWISSGGISEIRIPNRPNGTTVERANSEGRGVRHTWDPDRRELRVAAPEGALVEVSFELSTGE